VVQRLIRSLTATIEDGTGLYQVDTRLRPSGRQGTLVSSWQAFQDYHRQGVQTWERQVLLKARPVGGDLELGGRVADWIRSFLFSERPDAAAMRADIDRLRARMEKELAEEQSGFYNLKLGRGGLLDVDFVAQYFQLCHGARQPALQARSTLEVLAALERERLLAPAEASTLIGGYRFLRRIESWLRIVRDRSAESLPASADGLEVMARRLGYRRQRERSAGEQLLADYRQQTEAIRVVYGRVLDAQTA
jgi:glutamate-ammonia-ligase adenylyltransferase